MLKRSITITLSSEGLFFSSSLRHKKQSLAKLSIRSLGPEFPILSGTTEILSLGGILVIAPQYRSEGSLSLMS